MHRCEQTDKQTNKLTYITYIHTDTETYIQQTHLITLQ